MKENLLLSSAENYQKILKMLHQTWRQLCAVVYNYFMHVLTNFTLTRVRDTLQNATALSEQRKRTAH